MTRFFCFPLPCRWAWSRYLALLFGTALTLPTRVQAQAPTWQSALAAGYTTAAIGGVSSYVRTTATDASGNIYVAGQFAGTLTLGPFTLTSAGGTDAFVAKWDPVSETFRWAQRAGGPNGDSAQELAVAGTDVYVGGSFMGTATFGPHTLTAVGMNDLFVAKLSAAGTGARFTWALSGGGATADGVGALAVSGANVYVAGYFISPTMQFGGTTLTSAGNTDAFLARLTDAGASASLAWIEQVGGPGEDFISSLALGSAAVYAAGSFGGGTFASTSLALGSHLLTSAGNADAFAARFTDTGSAGTVAWAVAGGGPGIDGFNSVAVSGADVYVAGTFRSDTAAFQRTRLINSGPALTYDAVVAHLVDRRTSADFTWVRQIGGPADETVNALAVTGSALYAAGSFSSAVAGFDSLTLATAGQADVFVAKITTSATAARFAWAQRAGGAGDDNAVAVLVQGARVWVAGRMLPVARFGTIALAASGGPVGYVGYLASLGPSALAVPDAADTAAEIALSPNPAHGTTQLWLPAAAASAHLGLTDMLGRTSRLAVADAGNGSYTLDLTGLAAGIYHLRVAANGRQWMRRLVVD